MLLSEKWLHSLWCNYSLYDAKGVFMRSINNLEMELKQVCQTVETVYKDLCVQSEVRMWGCILL